MESYGDIKDEICKYPNIHIVLLCFNFVVIIVSPVTDSCNLFGSIPRSCFIALVQSYGCLDASEATLNDIGNMVQFVTAAKDNTIL